MCLVVKINKPCGLTLEFFSNGRIPIYVVKVHSVEEYTVKIILGGSFRIGLSTIIF